MSEYITKFNTISDYNNANVKTPNVSLIADTYSVIYKPKEFLKFKATYSDSTTYTVDCNGDGTLTQNETRGHSTSYTAMTSAEIGDCVDTIPVDAFRDCGRLTNVVFSNTVTIIKTNAFYGCSQLPSITIPDSVTTIGESVFRSCTLLRNITIGSGITTIGSSAFFLATVDSFTIKATVPPTIGSTILGYTNCPIYVPAESVEAYKAASGWSTYASRIQAIPT